MLYDLSHMWNLKQMQAHRYREQTGGCHKQGGWQWEIWMKRVLKKKREENSLAVQWLELSAFTTRPGFRSLLGELRSRICHVVQPKKSKQIFLKKKPYI